jgi:hypothetical protein
MTPIAPAPARPALLFHLLPLRMGTALGCLAAAAALLLGGCGGGSATPVSSPAAATGGGESTGAPATAAAGSGAGSRATTAGDACAKRLDPFLASLQSLRRRLEVGLSYEQYVAALGKARSAYAELPVDRLSLGCLLHSGTPGEKALDKYIDAANAWGECLAEAGCSASTIEATLQDEWHVAAHLLGEVGADS